MNNQRRPYPVSGCNHDANGNQAGDVNGDGIVNIADVNALVEYLLGRKAQKETPEFEEITLDGSTYKLGVSGAIDLGLSVRWASFNVGAASPYEYGDFFAWGETEPYYLEGHSLDNPCSEWKDEKAGYSNLTYFDYLDGSYTSPMKYSCENMTTLEPKDDVARISLGDDWRMPTKEELVELCTKCTWIWNYKNGNYGYIVIGKNGNAIFLPCAGYRYGNIYQGGDGLYWSSTLCDNYNQPYYAYYLNINQNGSYTAEALMYRQFGLNVRPVR